MWSQLLRWRSGPAATVTTTARPLIHRLPPEVLGHCFDFLKLSDRMRSATVCSYWRCVALDHAEPWCDLEDVEIAALPELLARTKRAGVRLVLHEVNDFSVGLICDALGPHMNHMRHLDLWLQPRAGRGYFNDLEYVLCSPAPLLETFSLVIEGAFIMMSPGTTFLAGVAPNLRNLRMQGWHFRGSSSSAAHGITTLHIHALSATHTSSWSYMFPALRELHVYDLPDPDWLWWPGNPFPAHLCTLVLEFSDSEYAMHEIADDVLELLQQADFTGLDELTLVDASAPLLDLVMLDLGPVVSLELLDCGPHVRLVTAEGRAINFMRAWVDGLEDVLLRHAPLVASLRELHVDRNVLGCFETCTLAHISRIAPSIERLVLTLGASDVDLLDTRNALELPDLRELRLQGAPRACVRADVLADFVSTLPVLAPPPRLTLAGVEIVGERASLDRVLQAQFSEICEIPRTEEARPRTQRADMFIGLPDSDSDNNSD